MTVPRRPAGRPVPTAAAEAEQIRADFLGRVAGVGQFLLLLEHVSSPFFFLKDDRSRMIWVSDTALDRFGLRAGEETVGKTDYDFFPAHVADNFVRDDRAVMRTGKPLVGQSELWLNPGREPEWSVTTKVPVFDGNGRAAGVFGMVRNSAAGGKAVPPGSPVGRAVAHIEAHLRGTVAVDDLARVSGLSARQLLREFHDAFGVSVQEFVVRTRVHAAADALLEDGATIAQVAAAFGFCDQSAFTKQFHKVTAMTPRAFRRAYHPARAADPRG